MSGRRVGRALAWQGVALALTITIIGLPLGMALGSLLWRSIAHQLGTLPRMTIPTSVLLVIPAAIVVGMLAAAIPTRGAAADSTSASCSERSKDTSAKAPKSTEITTLESTHCTSHTPTRPTTASSLLSSLQLGGTRRIQRISRRRRACSADVRALVARSHLIYTIFEGTSEIQRLVVARSISGLHIP